MFHNKSILKALCIVSTIISSPWACIGPMAHQSAGVFFNSNEIFDFTRFSQLGTEGIHYLMECEKPPSNVEKVRTENPPDNSDLVSITGIDINGPYLSIDVSYSGGCKKHDFTLYGSESLLKIYPPIINLQLHHDNNDDACRQYIQETLIFDLSSMLENTPLAYLQVMTIDNKSEKMSLLYYQNNHCRIKYQSHFNPNAMVYLDFSSLYFSKNQIFPRMTIILDPDLLLFAPIHRGNLVRDELQWLEKNNIVLNVRSVDMENIPDALGINPLQYWTHQDSALSYNCFYEYETGNRVTWGDLLCVKAPCGEDITYELPPKPLGDATYLHMSKKTSDRMHLNVSQNKKILALMSQLT